MDFGLGRAAQAKQPLDLERQSKLRIAEPDLADLGVRPLVQRLILHAGVEIGLAGEHVKRLAHEA